MPDSQVGQAFSIERRQRLLVETDGQARETSEIFVKVYRDMATSGLLAELSGNELKVLLTLGLEAKVLGGDAEAERHFARLKALGVVTDADRGRLFCYLDRDTIAERTGLSTRTVSTAGNALESKGLIEKRSVRNRSGRHDYNIYFIRPASHLGKFDFNRRSSVREGQGESHRGKIFPTVETMGKEPPAVGFPHVKKSRCSGSGEDLDSEVFDRFSERQGVTCYEPTDRDRSGLARVRSAGYSQDQILSAICKTFDGRDPGAEPIRRFTYCLPILRSQEPAHQPPQPGPNGSPVASPSVEGASTPTETSLPSNGSLPQKPQPVPNRSPAVTPLMDESVSAPSREVQGNEGKEMPVPPGNDGWEQAIEQMQGRVQKTGWPISSTMQTALVAKAVRVDEAARQQGADGPDWVGEAMLISLGRKVGKNGHPAPTDEELLAYADGILTNWTLKGKPSRRKKAKGVRPSPRRVSSGNQELPSEVYDSHLLVREPKSEEELLWERILGELKLQMSRATFDQWLGASKLLELQRSEEAAARLVVGVRSHYGVDWLEQRLEPTIQRTVEWLLGREAELVFQPLTRCQA